MYERDTSIFRLEHFARDYTFLRVTLFICVAYQICLYKNIRERDAVSQEFDSRSEINRGYRTRNVSRGTGNKRGVVRSTLAKHVSPFPDIPDIAAREGRESGGKSAQIGSAAGI